MRRGDIIRHGAKWVFTGNTGKHVIKDILELTLPERYPSKRFSETAQGSVWQEIRGHVLGFTKRIESNHSSWMAHDRHTQLGDFVWSPI